MKKLVLAAFGGDSPEHDISVVTGLQALKNVDGTHYTVLPLYLKGGVFYSGKRALDIEFFKYPELKLLDKVFFLGKTLYKKGKFCNKKIGDVYCVLNCFHGGQGEGGGAQGLLKTVGVADTSPDVFASALLMDKCASKCALEHMDIRTLEYLKLEKQAYRTGKITLNEVIDSLGFPIIVKPAHLGSSIGITVAWDIESLIKAVDSAFLYDNTLLVERALIDFYELNIAVYRSLSEVVLSDVERPARREEILDFADKYLNGAARGLEGLKREIPAAIPKELQEEVEQTAMRLYETLRLTGVIRIDFLYDNVTQKLYLNEVNTVPGSLAVYLFRGKKKTARRVITDLIEVGAKRKKEEDALVTSFPSSVLSKIPFSIKK